ncbi:homeobox-leucine zipper protein GLABRA 2 isoform X2 [Argentina anserina]|uniref:homeobox-leucine zipper protein GLABRA 2 isoform X2 n=1 Tax=Argentina anserina TaxID=57926 RepID=UPI00217663DC|nr:homeobox-leucine zipper protein GLABRA 2 isoform X2 [Potentilla anserina]
MGVVDMSNNPPTSRTKDFFVSPALSLSLAGIFRDAGTPAETTANREGGEGDEGSVGGRRRSREDTADISSENSGPARSRSAEDIDFDAELGEQDEDDGDGDNKNKKKKRKKYHRHTTEQIREMEALFKESPHPDEKQRQQLSKQLGLAPRQVKFWFQNRRTQIKAIQERHENSLLKGEMEKLRDENKAMREKINKACCPNCGSATTSKDASLTTEEQQLRIENARLKSEVEKLRAALVKYPLGTSSPSTSTAQDQENRSSLDFYTGIFGLEKSRIMEIVNQAMEELQKMATAGEPLWVRSVETGREILNYDEYIKEFNIEIPATGRPKRSIEASRETGVVFVDLPKLVQSFMDVNQWKEMFPSMISKAATVDVISNGEGDNRNGAVQLMFAELQMLTPLVPTREVYFVRCSKQLSAEQWAVVDVSIDKVEDNIDVSLVKCRKRPSGCIIEDKSNGHCKVIWVEHLECQKSTIQTMYRSIVNSGLAFGARHWVATLQLQCERLVFFMATNVPMKDSTGVATLAGRKSILKMAQRMTSSFCRAIGASSYHTWTKISSKTGDDIRIASRKNLNDPGEPLGVILCAVSSVWLPVSPFTLFDFLRDETRRNEWDIMLNGGPAQTIANLSKGQDRGNAVTIQTMKSKENSMWILQDSCVNSYESMVVYAPVDITGMQSVMTGCDSSNMAVLSSGFSILPDGLESRPMVITSRKEDRGSDSEGGTLLTVAFQVLTNTSPTAKLTMESVESANTLISCTLINIKTSLQCEDG